MRTETVTVSENSSWDKLKRNLELIVTTCFCTEITKGYLLNIHFFPTHSYYFFKMSIAKAKTAPIIVHEVVR